MLIALIVKGICSASKKSYCHSPVSEHVLEAGEGGGGMSSLSEDSLLSPHFRIFATGPRTSDATVFFSPLPLLPLVELPLLLEAALKEIMMYLHKLIKGQN